MTCLRHSPQHKPKREARTSRELADLKRENNQLRRKVSRLQKEVERTEFLSEVQCEETDTRTEDESEAQQKGCPECGSLNPPLILENALSIVRICRECRHSVSEVKESD